MKNNIIFFLCVIMLAGCAKQGAWVYHPNSYDTQEKSYNMRVAVLPFSDARDQEKENKILLYMIPIVPYGWGNMTQPTLPMQATPFDPKEDFAKALAEELSNSCIFKESYFSYTKKDTDIICSGSVLDTNYHVKIYSYGLSVFSSLFWLLGLPAGSVENALAVKLYCTNISSGKKILEKVYTAKPYKVINNVYSQKSNFHYPVMLQEVYKEFIADLQAKMEGQTVTEEEIRNAPPESVAPEQ